MIYKVKSAGHGCKNKAANPALFPLETRVCRLQLQQLFCPWGRSAGVVLLADAKVGLRRMLTLSSDVPPPFSFVTCKFSQVRVPVNPHSCRCPGSQWGVSHISVLFLKQKPEALCLCSYE